MNIRLTQFFHRLDFSCNRSDRLYLACKNNDLAQVESCLKDMTLKEINFQHSPNNETVLHIATRSQHKEIIKILLTYGARPSIRDLQGKQASELPETEEIKELYKRPSSSRFVFPQNDHKLTSSSQQNLDCKSCSLVNDNDMYEWELVDRNAAHKALRFRRELQEYATIDTKIWRRKFYSLNKGYLTAHLQDRPPTISTHIRKYFQSALIEQNPEYIAIAYSSSQSFATLLNKDMARNVIHALRNGCSQFSCQCLYATQDGTETVSSIFLHHPTFQKFAFKGEVYRGIIMPKYKLDHCKVGSCIITTTFLSTSKEEKVARIFSAGGDVPHTDLHSFFCTYKIAGDSHTAIDISELSIHPEEDEVLILPYSSFRITKIEEEQERTKIYLEEQSLLDILSHT